MALKIKWSKKAKNRYREILNYLHNEWSEKEVADFINKTDRLLKVILLHPYGFQASSRKNIRKAVVGKQNSLFYRITDTHIYLITFWDNRRDPKKNKY